VPVSHVDEVLRHALAALPEPIEWTEADDLASQPSTPAPGATASPVAH
jgi:ATP-dependent Lon protease